MVMLFIGVLGCGGAKRQTTSSGTVPNEGSPQSVSTQTASEDPWPDAPTETERDSEVATNKPVQANDVPIDEGVLGVQWQCTGEVDAPRLQAELDATASDFQACFVDTMLAQGVNRIELRILARVGRGGAVTDHVVRSVPALAGPIGCAGRVVQERKLPRPRRGACYVVDYPLRFSIER